MFWRKSLEESALVMVKSEFGRVILSTNVDNNVSGSNYSRVSWALNVCIFIRRQASVWVKQESLTHCSHRNLRQESPQKGDCERLIGMERARMRTDLFQCLTPHVHQDRWTWQFTLRVMRDRRWHTTGDCLGRNLSNRLGTGCCTLRLVVTFNSIP